MRTHSDLYKQFTHPLYNDRLMRDLEAQRKLEELMSPPAAVARELFVQREIEKHERLQKMLGISSSLPGSAERWLWEHSHVQREVERITKLQQPDHGWAIEQAFRSQRLGLPDILEPFRTPSDILASRIAQLGLRELFEQRPEAFTQASAMADFLAKQERIDKAVETASRSFATSPIPYGLGSVARYGSFLDAAGLVLPHWPRRRLLTRAEKQRRLRARLRENAPPRHVIQGATLVQKYERTLREIIDEQLCEVYGEDWAETRLLVCECKDLLGRWRARQGAPLDHADFAHYEKIMCNPEHFEAVFSIGYEDPEVLRSLLVKARKHRAAAVHGGEFTEEDLQDLRLTFRQLEIGLAALVSDEEDWEDADGEA